MLTAGVSTLLLPGCGGGDPAPSSVTSAVEPAEADVAEPVETPEPRPEPVEAFAGADVPEPGSTPFEPFDWDDSGAGSSAFGVTNPPAEDEPVVSADPPTGGTTPTGVAPSGSGVEELPPELSDGNRGAAGASGGAVAAAGGTSGGPKVFELKLLEPPAEKAEASRSLASAVLGRARNAASTEEALYHLRRLKLLYETSGQIDAVVDDLINTFEERRERGLVRSGGDWITPDERTGRRIDARHDLLLARELLLSESYGEAQSRLEEASRADPGGVDADYVAGLVYVLSGIAFFSEQSFTDVQTAQHAVDGADRHFAKVLERRDEDISALNNMAVVQVKQRDFKSALKHWERAVALGPATPELAHNLGRVTSLINRRLIADRRTSVTKDLGNLYARLARNVGDRAHDPNRGWLLMPLLFASDFAEDGGLANQGGRNVADPTYSRIAIGSGTGFVVGDGLVVTNRTVALVGDRPADELEVVAAGTGFPQAAELVAYAIDRDLALLRVPGLRAPALPLDGHPPAVRQQVMLLGFSAPGSAGAQTEGARGMIERLPRPEDEGMLFLDAAGSPGNSGGPVMTDRGTVLGVLSVGDNVGRGRAGAAIAGDVSALLGAALPDGILPAAAGREPRPFPEVQEDANPSVVQVLANVRAVRFSLLKNESDSHARAWEDRSCPVCNGGGDVHCLVKDCDRGKVTRTETIVTLRDRRTGKVLATQQKPVHPPCDVCGGTDAVDCPHCDAPYRGIDPDLIR